jgi:hypothetical protein
VPSDPNQEPIGSVTGLRIADVGDAKVGKQLARSGSSASSVLPYFRVANVHDDALHLDDVLRMPFEPDERVRYMLEPGDILLCEGQSRELVGRCAMFRGELATVGFQNTLIRFRPHPGVDPEFALLIFRIYQKTGVFSSISRATTNLAHLSLARFRDLPFPKVEHDAQVMIGQRARELQEAVDQLTNALATALVEASEVLREARQETFLQFLSSAEIEPLPEVPADWSWVTAADCVLRDAPIVYGIVKAGPDYPDGVPYIRGGELRDGFILVDALRRTSPAIAEQYKRSQLRTGDVLIGLVRDPRVAIVPNQLDGANIARGIARLRPTGEFRANYLRHWLAGPMAQDWLLQQMRGIDMPSLNLRHLRQLPVPMPPLHVQDEIAERLDESERSAGLMIASLGDMRDHVDATSISLMADLVPLIPAPNPTSTDSDIAIAPEPQRRTAQTRDTRRVAELSASDIVELTRASSSGLTPEDLFEGLGLEEADVDSFFLFLRDAISARRLLSERQPDGSVVLTAP